MSLPTKNKTGDGSGASCVRPFQKMIDGRVVGVMQGPARGRWYQPRAEDAFPGGKSCWCFALDQLFIKGEKEMAGGEKASLIP